MAVFLLITFFITSVGLRFDMKGEIGADYLSKETTTCVNGIFVLLIILSHYTNFPTFPWATEALYLAFRRHTQQLVVATFLFYSGYGMETRIKASGWDYIAKLPDKFFRLLFKFDIAVIAFLIVQTMLGESFPMRQILLSLTGWESIGNSNWYIFVILVMYMLMFLCYNALRPLTKEAKSCINATAYLIITVMFIFLMIRVKRPDYFYNTVILMPLGGIYALTEDKIRTIINKSPIIHPIIIAVMTLAYFLAFSRRDESIVFYVLWVICFMTLMLLITMRVRIYNDLLYFMGKHVFSIYIVQRIPMLILDYCGIIETHQYAGLIAAATTTVALALCFEKVTDGLLNVITQEKR